MPCQNALAMAKVPARKWGTREDILTRMEQVRVHLDSCEEAVKLDDLAAMCMLSPYHFHRMFKQTYGRTPLDYHRRVRLLKAHVLLSTRYCTVAEACIEVGFSSVSSFSRLFRQTFGYSPGQTPAKWSKLA